MFAASPVSAQGHVTTPKEFFGHNIGDDYWLPNYDQFLAYWKKIDGESDRMQAVEIGKTSEGRPQMAAIITDPANFKLLEKYRDISMKLAKGENLTDEQAHALAKEGKAVACSTAVSTRRKSSACEPADRDDLPAPLAQRRRDEAHPQG